MKPRPFFWGLAFFLTFCLGPAALAQERCRRVQVWVKAAVTPVDASYKNLGEGRGLRVCYASGKLKLEMLFPLAGGPVRAQKNSVALTSFACKPYGTARPCQSITPDPGAFRPSAFQVWARLYPDASFTESAAGGNSFDVLEFVIKPIPPRRPVWALYSCDGMPANTEDYGMAYRQLLRPLYENVWSHQLPLNRKFTTNRVIPDLRLLNRLFRAKLNLEFLQTLVPCKNFP